MGTAKAGRVGVVREAEDRDVGVVVGHIVRVDPRDVGDHDVRRVDPVGCLEPVIRKQRLELAPQEQLDATQQNRRHA